MYKQYFFAFFVPSVYGKGQSIGIEGFYGGFALPFELFRWGFEGDGAEEYFQSQFQSQFWKGFFQQFYCDRNPCRNLEAGGWFAVIFIVM
jgi:hypothetical protein